MSTYPTEGSRSRLTERYNSRPESRTSRGKHERSRNSRSVSPIRYRLPSDRKSSNYAINAYISTSYININNRFNIGVGICFEPAEYKRIDTACTFYIMHPPNVYVELISCIVIILILTKHNLDDLELNIYSKIKIFETCMRKNLPSRYKTEVILKRVLNSLIDQRTGTVNIRGGPEYSRSKAELFDNAKKSAKIAQNNESEEYLPLIPKIMREGVGGDVLYAKMRRASALDACGDKGLVSKHRSDLPKELTNGNLQQRAKDPSSPSNETTTTTATNNLKQESINLTYTFQSSATPSSSNMQQQQQQSDTPPGWPSQLRFPLSFDHAIQLILTIASLTVPPPVQPITTFPPPPSPSPQPFRPPMNIHPGTEIPVTCAYNTNHANSFVRLPPSNDITYLPPPSRSGSLNLNNRNTSFSQKDLRQEKK